MTWLDKILAAVSIAASVAKSLGAPGASIASAFISIAQAANAAHKDLTGKDIDPATLGQLPPLPPL